MDQMFFGALMGALLFRLRGAAAFHRITGRGKTTADAVWATGLAVMAWPGLWETPALAVMLWLGGRPGWWRSLTLGRNPADGPAWRQWTRHTARGLLWTAPAALLAWWLGASPVLLVLAGLACAPAYEAGWRLAGRAGLGGTEWGEYLFGACVGAALLLTL
ncbi:MAG: hypothetical protein ACK5VI_09530 [Opitutia bacterium]